MMNYVKPDVFVTKFSANAFCANCVVTTYNKPVTVKCIKTQSETVYSSGVSGCDFTGEDLVSFPGGYFRGDMGAIKAFSDGEVTSDEYRTNQSKEYYYYLEQGDYLVWYGQGNYHVGPVGEAESASIKNHS